MPNDTHTSTPSPAESRRQAIGEAITSLREVDLISVAELAGRLGVAQRSVTRWENGEVDLSFEQALAIEDALEVPRGYLGAAGRFFSYETSPACTEEIVDVHEFVRWSDAQEALAAAACLGMGLRVRNEFRPDPGEVDDEGEVTMSTEWWVMDLLTRPPSTDIDLDW